MATDLKSPECWEVLRLTVVDAGFKRLLSCRCSAFVVGSSRRAGLSQRRTCPPAVHARATVARLSSRVNVAARSLPGSQAAQCVPSRGCGTPACSSGTASCPRPVAARGAWGTRTQQRARCGRASRRRGREWSRPLFQSADAEPRGPAVTGAPVRTGRGFSRAAGPRGSQGTPRLRGPRSSWTLLSCRPE